MMDLAAMRARCAAATDGPWQFDHGRVWQRFPKGDLTEVPFQLLRTMREAETGQLNHERRSQAKANWEFVAAAREDSPALLDEVERLRGLLTRAHDVLGDLELCMPESTACESVFDAAASLSGEIGAALEDEGPERDASAGLG